MIACPLCGAPSDPEIGLCACGYNAREVAGLERELSIWKRRRLVSLATFAVGFGILMVVPAVSLELAAATGGLLVSAGTVFWAWSRYYMGATKRELRAARTRKALPEARLV